MPRPRKIKNVGPKISDTLAARLLDVLRHGRPAFDANGCPVLDDDGNPVMRPPSNSDFKTALDWLKYHGEKGSSAYVDPVELAMQKINADANANDIAGRIRAAE